LVLARSEFTMPRGDHEGGRLLLYMTPPMCTIY
jgi:hypothetical protein